MPETPEMAHDIKQIRFELESIKGTVELLLREKNDTLLAQMLEIFARTPQLREVYLAVDGRTQGEIVAHLTANGVKTSQPTVSRRLSTLEEYGLIEKADSRKGIVLKRKDVIERVLRLSKALNGKN